MSWFSRWMMSRWYNTVEMRHALDGKPRRDGKGGWTKGECEFSRTGWAWVQGHNCSCQPAKKPRGTDG